MLRALAFDFRQDPHVYNIADQYLFGPAFLVNPVTEPMYYLPGSRPLPPHSHTRRVYLPSGSDWYDFWTGRRFSGGTNGGGGCSIERFSRCSYVRDQLYPLARLSNPLRKPEAPPLSSFVSTRGKMLPSRSMRMRGIRITTKTGPFQRLNCTGTTGRNVCILGKGKEPMQACP